MAKKAIPHPSPYSAKYGSGNGRLSRMQTKLRMLYMTSIPDDDTVMIDYIDRRGSKFITKGNLNLPIFSEIEREEVFLGGREGIEPQFTMPDFAFNRTCDADANKKGLELARSIIAKYQIPVLNPPEKIQATTRDAIYQRFANYDGIVVPKAIRISPGSSSDIRALLEQGDVRLPCILRPTGGHNSRGVFLIKELNDTDNLERFAFDGRDYYLIEFHDCRDSDGLSRKFRVISVDGKAFPRHLFVSDNWCVDGNTKSSDEKYWDEEKYFLENFHSYLGEDVVSRLNGFCAQIGLDFFGLDLNLRPDGTLVLFEANACMAAFQESNRDYVKPIIDNIRAATREMLLRFHQMR